MERDGRFSHSWRKWLAGFAVVVVALFSGQAAFAQVPERISASEEVADAGMRKVSSGVEQVHTGETTVNTAATVTPPLPFQAPQVGPVIKRTFADDVDKRTTAFIPQARSLWHLSAVKFPQDEAKWIRVDLSEQTVVAYEDNKPVRAFIISSGLPRTPTVTGEFRIRTKVKAQTMSGGTGAYYYSLPGVKWVQYFYGDYSFHGTYWHNDFGQPKSHGCINMTNADAKWLFDWAGPVWDGKTIWFGSTKENPGTLVIVTE
jgi:lipoprotein-anchoring transpeptidase ErfK/SrfK